LLYPFNMDQNLPASKLYYSIREVAAMLSVNASLIRFWEKEFDIIHPRKNKKGSRFFTQEDIDNLHRIYRLVKVKGYTLQGAREKLKSDQEGMGNELEMIKSLNKVREGLIRLRDSLETKD